MIKSVVREHHWAPDTLGVLFYDREDYLGLLYWYEDIIEVHKELKNKK